MNIIGKTPLARWETPTERLSRNDSINHSQILVPMVNIILADSHGPVMGKDQTSANLSLLYMASHLRNHSKQEVNLTYIPQAKSDQFHLQQLAEFKADVYAVSFTSFSALATYELINRIKKQNPEVLVVCGGPHAIEASQEILEESESDICVIGEGEDTLVEIIDNIDNLDSCLDNIKGLSYLKEGKYHCTPTRPLIDDLDTVAFPARDLVNNEDYCGLTYSKARPNTEMVVTRGCPLRCVFCANPVFRLKNGPLYRARSPENIAGEVEQLYQMGYREIYIHSDELNVKLDWSINVCKKIAALGHKDLFFQCNLRVVPMSEEFAYWLKKANFWMVRVGIESTSNRVLKGIKKRMSFEKTAKTCKILSDQGIKVFAFMMLFNYWEEDGKLCHEAPEEVRQTIKDIYKLWWKGHLNYSSWAFACPVQGSEFYDIALRHGLIDKDYYPNDTWDSFSYLTGVTKKEFNGLYAAARRQQGLMALRAGNFEWRNYKGILRKARTMITGRPDVSEFSDADLGKKLKRRERKEIEKLENAIAPYRKKLLEHELYKNVNSDKDIRLFMEKHVFAVWDFMSLLKALQNSLTSTTVPWTPKGNPISRRLINDIVLGEESDVNQRNETVSHFEMYLSAMHQIGAEVSPINKFSNLISSGSTYHEAARQINLDEQVKEFIDFTFEIIYTDQEHIMASVFTFGREDLIPDMFIAIVKNLQKTSNTNFSKLIYYLERHIELDGDEHGPMSLKMIAELCGDDQMKWKEAADVSIQALNMRLKLWDAINADIVTRKLIDSTRVNENDALEVEVQD